MMVQNNKRKELFFSCFREKSYLCTAKIEYKNAKKYKMKKVFSLLTVLLLVSSVTVVNARNLPEKDVKSAGAYYMGHYAGRNVDASDLEVVLQFDNEELGVPAAFLFNVSDWGWVMMAANTATDPVIAYNEHCTFPTKDVQLPDNMRWWVNNYVDMVKAVQIADEDQHFEDAAEWTELINMTLPELTKGDNPEHILMNEEWDQGNDDGTDYNMFSPVVNGIHCPTGCVATALAQIMHYYRYPVQPRLTASYSWNGQTLAINFDTVTFDYSLMPNRITSASTLEQRREVSELGYSVAVAMKMSFNAEGSGAYSHKVPSAMSNYFKYKGNRTLLDRNGNGDTAYINAVRNELKHQRPVYMHGSTPESFPDDPHAGGHAWVCCGYRDDRPAQYWMNWGWSTNMTEANGWYNLKTNNMPIDGTHYNFNSNQGVIIDMYPPQDSTHINILGIEEVVNNAYLSAAYPNPATVSVKLPYSINMPADMTIYSIDGKLVERRSLKAGNGEVELNVSKMPSGIYIYRLGGATGKFLVQ